MGGAKRSASRGANLLPFTKFVGNGLLIKCMGQVDLPDAPLNIAPPIQAPAGPGCFRFPWGIRAED
ncbi:hypothetical protein K030075H31_09210 [Blautia producta]